MGLARDTGRGWSLEACQQPSIAFKVKRCIEWPHIHNGVDYFVHFHWNIIRP
jgi:hypothetical protein